MRILKFVLLFFAIFVVAASFLVGVVVFNSNLKSPVSILLMGKGGIGHEAPDLTDAIILATITDSGITLISLPRDIWVPEIRAKINSAYYWGKQKNEGFKLIDDAVASITSVTPNYNLVIDFSIFKKLIDVMGGIDVDVKNTFVDEKYPIAGKEADPCIPCRYETLHFAQGKQLMDGETALKFVRSRNAKGEEGTDFAREARQQLVIEALKNKVLSTEILLNFKKLQAIREVFVSSIETDIPNDLFIGFIKKVYSLRNNINFEVIPESMFTIPPISPKYDRQYVLIPKSGYWSELQKWIKSL